VAEALFSAEIRFACAAGFTKAIPTKGGGIASSLAPPFGLSGILWIL